MAAKENEHGSRNETPRQRYCTARRKRRRNVSVNPIWPRRRMNTVPGTKRPGSAIARRGGRDDETCPSTRYGREGEWTRFQERNAPAVLLHGEAEETTKRVRQPDMAAKENEHGSRNETPRQRYCTARRKRRRNVSVNPIWPRRRMNTVPGTKRPGSAIARRGGRDDETCPLSERKKRTTATAPPSPSLPQPTCGLLEG